MARAAEGDILAYVVQGTAQLEAECQAQLASAEDDPLTKDFAAGHFFEATDMSLGMALSDSESGSGLDYWGWIRRPTATGTNVPYKVVPDELEITRLVDRASPLLLQYCLEQKDLASVVLVKRQSIGGSRPLGFLRIVLGRARLKSIRWADGHAVTETCAFGFQDLTVEFQPFGPGGVALDLKQAEWNNPLQG